MDLNETCIEKVLAKSLNPDLPPESPYPQEFVQTHILRAAVLLPFLRKEGQWHLLFIRRTFHEEDRHKGQVAFPGGRCNSQDQSAEAAALREAFEETGILPEDVKILGRLRDMLTITGYQVTPIVGAIPWPYHLIPQPEEVSRIFTVPLHWLADPNNRVIRNREIQIQGKSVPVIYFKQYEGEILWGASARITMLLLEALGFSRPEERYQPNTGARPVDIY
jgi:8-oxo-dGTP pyrophosphatase MutT (NUDIX family)